MKQTVNESEFEANIKEAVTAAKDAIGMTHDDVRMRFIAALSPHFMRAIVREIEGGVSPTELFLGGLQALETLLSNVIVNVIPNHEPEAAEEAVTVLANQIAMEMAPHLVALAMIHLREAPRSARIDVSEN